MKFKWTLTLWTASCCCAYIVFICKWKGKSLAEGGRTRSRIHAIMSWIAAQTCILPPPVCSFSFPLCTTVLWQVGFWLQRAPPSAKPPCNHLHLFTVSSPQFYSEWQPDVLTWAAAVLCIEQYDGVILQLGRTDQTAELRMDDGDSGPCRHHVALFVPIAHQHTYV